jgi:outer membrane protein
MKTNRLFQAVLLAVAVGCLAVTPASAQPKTGTVNLKKVFDGYWKTKQADLQLKDRAGEFQKQSNELIENYKKANEEYKKILDSASDQALATEEREKRKKASETKLMELKDLEVQIGQFDRSAKTNLGEQQRRMRENILKEIQEAVATKAKAAGYSMVWDTAAESINSTPVVVYTTNENDLSEEVLKQLNLNAPADLPKPAEEKPASGSGGKK